MRKLILTFTAIMACSIAMAQVERDLDEINETNSWLKVGANVGAPVGVIDDVTTFSLALDVSGQFMRTDNFGLGITSGYNHYFRENYNENSNKTVQGIGVIPAELMFRYYPYPEGFFAGADLGYSFIVNSPIQGGFSMRPHLGYHNYDWNFFAYYNHVYTVDSRDVQSIGVGATYNFRFE